MSIVGDNLSFECLIGQSFLNYFKYNISNSHLSLTDKNTGHNIVIPFLDHPFRTIGPRPLVTPPRTVIEVNGMDIFLTSTYPYGSAV